MNDHFFQRAHLLIQQGRFHEAEKELRNVLMTEPGNADALCLMAICSSNLDKLKEAEDFIRQAISIEPANSSFLYIYASILLQMEKPADAEKLIWDAIRLNPQEAEYYRVLASIEADRKNWQKALEYANQGLSHDPDNLGCLNIRSTVLIKLDKKEEAYDTIREALNQDPDNAYTHANVGWGMLEKGDHKAALEHFRKSLQMNPNNSWAKAGLVESLKARYYVYRLFLRYAFWISNLKGMAQWAVILGLYFGVTYLRSISDSNPGLKPFLTPIIVAYTVFALSSWLITPLSNLFLRLNKYGRYALTRNEILSSNFVGISMALGLMALGAYVVTDKDLWLGATVLGLTMMIPFAVMLQPSGKKGRTVLIAYTVGLGMVGMFSLLLVSAGADLYNTVSSIYLFGLVAFQWIANGFMMSK